MSKIKSVVSFLICLSIPLIVGGMAGYATSAGVTDWYQTLHKPTFNPPGYVFGPVWTLLYIFMGISLYRVVESETTDLRKKALAIFCVQLLLNFAWSFLFFMFHRPDLALIEIVLLWVSIFYMIKSFYRVDQIAAYLQIPYLFWVSFASILNSAIWLLN